jgi:hypothetical protein
MMDSDFPMPADEMVPVQKAGIVKSRAERIGEIEEELHQESATVIADALHFVDLDPEAPEMPAGWVEELGEAAAKRRLRTAQYGLLPAKDAPVGLRIAKDALVGMAKVKAVKNAPAKTLNMIVVNMAGPLPVYEEMEVLKASK